MADISLDRKRQFLLDAGILVLLIFATLAIALLYVSREQTFYWWDLDSYHFQAMEVLARFRDSPSDAMQGILASLNQDYSQLYIVPLLPFVLAFGDSRIVYITGVVLAYVVPLALLCGAIATRLISYSPRPVFWSTVVLALLTPLVWIPSLRGFPDTGGAVLMLLAVWIYLHDLQLRRWWQIVGIGIAIAAAILFRRPFAYNAIAFILAALVQAVVYFGIEVRRRRPKAWRNLLQSLQRIGLTVLAGFVAMAIFAFGFVQRALTVDYRDLYTSWSQPVSYMIQYYGSKYGWGTWVLAIAGFGLAILKRVANRPVALFLALYGTFSLLPWLLLLRYSSIHYTLQVTPVVVLGLSALLWTGAIAWKQPLRPAILGIGCVYLFANAIFGLTPLGQFESAVRPVFADSYPPLVRSDYRDILKLVDYLRQTTEPGASIYVTENSRLLNLSVLRNAERQRYGREDVRLNFLNVPLVDSRDPYPIEALLQADYVLLAKPFDNFLPLEEADVLKTVFDAFVQNWAIAKDFQPLPQQFSLDNGVTATLYRRTRPTSTPVAIQTLDRMRSQIGKVSQQPDWIGLTPQAAEIAETVPNTYRIRTEGNAELLYIDQLPKSIRIRGNARLEDPPACAETTVQLSVLGQNGSAIAQRQIPLKPDGSTPLEATLTRSGANYVRLDLASQTGANDCTITLDRLTVTQATP